MAQIYVDASLTSHRRPNIHLRGNKLMRLEDYKIYLKLGQKKNYIVFLVE